VTVKVKVPASFRTCLIWY